MSLNRLVIADNLCQLNYIHNIKKPKANKSLSCALFKLISRSLLFRLHNPVPFKCKEPHECHETVSYPASKQKNDFSMPVASVPHISIPSRNSSSLLSTSFVVMSPCIASRFVPYTSGVLLVGCVPGDTVQCQRAYVFIE